MPPAGIAVNGTATPKAALGEHARPSKRPRMAQVRSAAIGRRKADEDTALEVDIMILDYLAFQATNACLASRISSLNTPISLPQNVRMCDAFLAVLQARHSNHSFDAELRFRILLLKLVTLFTQRLTRNPTTPSRSDSRQARESNEQRALTWIGSTHRAPSGTCSTSALDDPSAFPTIEELERNRAHVLHSLNVPAEDEAYEDAHYGTPACIALLDILPIFMQVSAARNAISGSNCTETWMLMAGEFMLQACLEQYLVFGAQGTDAVDEAFAWGYKDMSFVSAQQEDGMDMNAQEREIRQDMEDVYDMFTDTVYETEIGGWSAVKQRCLSELFPASYVPGDSQIPPDPDTDEEVLDLAPADSEGDEPMMNGQHDNSALPSSKTVSTACATRSLRSSQGAEDAGKPCYSERSKRLKEPVWSQEEDEAFIHGLNEGLKTPKILKKYNINRSASAARNRKKYLLVHSPSRASRLAPDDRNGAEQLSPGAKALVLRMAQATASQSDTKASHLPAGGADSHAADMLADENGDSHANSLEHLEMVAASHPVETFETTILGFLVALSQSISEPVLVQLEKGCLEGMSKQETSEFLRDCGLENYSLLWS